MTIGEKIKTVRKQRRMTQQQLAEKTGIQTRTIQRYESGNSRAKYNTLNQIANALSVPIEWFDESVELPEDICEFDRSKIVTEFMERNEKISAEDVEMLNAFHLLNLVGKSKLLEYAELLQLKYRKEE